jgi:hypothetical protein
MNEADYRCNRRQSRHEAADDAADQASRGQPLWRLRVTFDIGEVASRIVGHQHAQLFAWNAGVHEAANRVLSPLGRFESREYVRGP